MDGCRDLLHLLANKMCLYERLYLQVKETPPELDLHHHIICVVLSGAARDFGPYEKIHGAHTKILPNVLIIFQGPFQS